MRQRAESLWGRIAPRLVANPTNGCWEWQAALQSNGYAKLRFNGTEVYAHRAAFEEFRGPIPAGLVIDHLCRNRRCANPDHLDAVPNGVNVLRGESGSAKNAAKTHCVHGHEFDAANTYMWRNRRYCRACRATRSAAYAQAGAA